MSSGDATYHLVAMDGLLWPAVECAGDMVPLDELGVRPTGACRGVFVLGMFKFKWVFESDVYEFDPSASQRIPDSEHKAKLQEAFESVLGSPDKPAHPVYPDLNFWRSEILMRSLTFIENRNTGNDSGFATDNDSVIGSDSKENDSANDEGSAGDNDSDEQHDSIEDSETDSKVAPTPPRKAAAASHNVPSQPNPNLNPKPGWSKLTPGDSFNKGSGHGSSKKAKPGATNTPGRRPKSWIPDEDDEDNDPPSPGFFDRLKEDHDKKAAARARKAFEEECGVSESDSSSVDFSEEEEGQDDNETDGEDAVMPSRRRGATVKKTSNKEAASFPEDTDSRTLSPVLPNAALRARITEPLQSHSIEVMQLCRTLDAARKEEKWDEVMAISTKMLDARHSWTIHDSIMLAIVAFRVNLRHDATDVESDLRFAVAEFIALNYEQMREAKDHVLSKILRDYVDLAELVYFLKFEKLKMQRLAKEAAMEATVKDESDKEDVAVDKAKKIDANEIEVIEVDSD